MRQNKIRILPEKVANLIAAGEVVERPASVIKELIENSIDAGATLVEVEIRNAGASYIRVTDNGSGMLPEDAQLAFARHATSKIMEAVDLDHIHTMGFRGEAMPSIASVSRLEISTRPREATAGFKMKIEGGDIKTKQETGCAVGTTIIVKDLFYNTPARKKFMKTPATEQLRITQTFEFAAMSFQQIGFKLVIDGKEVLNCPIVTSLSERLLMLYGRSLPKELITLEHEGGGIWIRGLIAGPREHRNTRQGMHFFINHRPIEHRGIGHAVIQSYKGLIPDNRFPICYLFLEMPSHLVDVNVHPSKREVRLRDEHAIHQLVHTAIQSALKQSDLTGGGKLNKPWKFNKTVETYSIQEPLPSWSADRVKESIYAYFEHTENVRDIASDTEIVQTAGEKSQETELRVIGQVGKTYIAAQDNSGFFLVDQHAAHERLLYEKLKNSSEILPRQAMLVPLTFEVTPIQAIWLHDNLNLFSDMGIEISPLGGGTFNIQTQPTLLPKSDLVGIAIDVIEWAMENRKINSIMLREKAFQSMACKAAIKSNERLQPETMLSLIQQICQLTGLPTCPHGRPYIFKLSWDELDKIFKRDYAN